MAGTYQNLHLLLLSLDPAKISAVLLLVTVLLEVSDSPACKANTYQFFTETFSRWAVIMVSLKVSLANSELRL